MRVSAENWRIICPCQKHRDAFRPKVRRAFLVAGTLALLGASVPLDAFDFALSMGTGRLQVGARTGSPSPVWAEASLFETVEALEAVERGESGALSFFAEAALDPWGPVSLPTPVMIESVREQFFRAEVPFGEIIYREAKLQGLAPELVAAVVETESDFRPRLISHRNAHGLMQVLPSTAEFMGVQDVLDPVENIRAGTRYLRHLQEQFDDPVMVLAAYNAGPGRVREFGGIPPFQETRDYVGKVDRSRKRFHRQIAERIAGFKR